MRFKYWEMAVNTNWNFKDRPHLCKAGSEKHTFIQFPHPLQKLINIRPLKNIHLVYSSIYLHRNNKVSITDGLKKQWLAIKDKLHTPIIFTHK